MRKISLFLIPFLLFCGCVSNPANRYAFPIKQSKYVSLKFKIPQEEIPGKTKSEVRNIMGEPAQVLEKIDNGVTNEMWIYFPQGTNNFIAIIVMFDGDKAESASYESVM